MSGGKKVDTKHKTLVCPRDRSDMKEQLRAEAYIDVCPKCGGTFFDHGEMYAALGMNADPSYWDRPETTSSFADAPIHCPRCDGHMQIHALAHGTTKVDIDRCGHCRGIWLDKGEAEKIVAIGQGMAGTIDAERAAAQAELAKMGDVDFSPGLIARFLAMFKKKS